MHNLSWSLGSRQEWEFSFVDEIEQGLFSKGCNNRTVCKGGGAVERYSLLH